MSCVVGIVKNNTVWIGADSRASTDEGMIRYSSIPKLFKNKNFLIGFIGNVRTGQLLLPQYFDPPDDIYEWPDIIREIVKEKGCLSTTDENIEIMQSNFLIGFDDKLYEILCDFQLNRVYDYVAIGGGADLAYGSLYTTSLNTRMSAEKRVLISLEAACKFCATCGPPYVIKMV